MTNYALSGKYRLNQVICKSVLPHNSARDAICHLDHLVRDVYARGVKKTPNVLRSETKLHGENILTKKIVKRLQIVITLITLQVLM